MRSAVSVWRAPVLGGFIGVLAGGLALAALFLYDVRWWSGHLGLRWDSISHIAACVSTDGRLQASLALADAAGSVLGGFLAATLAGRAPATLSGHTPPFLSDRARLGSAALSASLRVVLGLASLGGGAPLPVAPFTSWLIAGPLAAPAFAAVPIPLSRAEWLLLALASPLLALLGGFLRRLVGRSIARRPVLAG